MLEGHFAEGAIFNQFRRNEKMKKRPLDILLVEDNDDHANLVILNFRAQDLPNRVYHVSDGEAALDYLFHRGN